MALIPDQDVHNTSSDSTITTLLYLLSLLNLSSLRYGMLPTVLNQSAFILTNIWREKVARHVPDAYLDEVFHIPQAQAYCGGDYGVWDPKLTTPAGLYIVAAGILKYITRLGCSATALRAVNTTVHVFGTMKVVEGCLGSIHGSAATRRKEDDIKNEEEDGNHITTRLTALNITLFPPLFFFTALFYTDVLSTFLVLAMYNVFLHSSPPAGQQRPFMQNVYLYLLGVAALWMRQTNVFWVAIYMGGRDVVEGLSKEATDSSVEILAKERRMSSSMRTRYRGMYSSWTRGQIHDVALRDANMQDVLLTPLSIAIAVVYQPIRVLNRVWPFILLLISFASFVVWNGGVVLGDKANHIPTLHLPQMLYLAAMIVFFSWPVVVPVLRDLVLVMLSLLPGRETVQHITSRLHISLVIPPSPSISSIIRTTLFTTFVLLLYMAVIHTNTLIHPFTLADNRHYVFYVFRYTILRHPLIRYMLAPMYVLCGWILVGALMGGKKGVAKDGMGTRTAMKVRTRKPCKKPHASLATAGPQRTSRPQEGVTLSFLLIYTLATTLSLITALLVEPRYFILPWVLWRMHVPPSSTCSSSPSTRKEGEEDKASRLSQMPWLLMAETAWFLLINFVTGYVFLHRGFEWRQEEGRVQRFMW